MFGAHWCCSACSADFQCIYCSIQYPGMIVSSPCCNVLLRGIRGMQGQMPDDGRGARDLAPWPTMMQTCQQGCHCLVKNTVDLFNNANLFAGF